MSKLRILSVAFDIPMEFGELRAFRGAVAGKAKWGNGLFRYCYNTIDGPLP